MYLFESLEVLQPFTLVVIPVESPTYSVIYDKVVSRVYWRSFFSIPNFLYNLVYCCYDDNYHWELFVRGNRHCFSACLPQRRCCNSRVRCRLRSQLLVCYGSLVATTPRSDSFQPSGAWSPVLSLGLQVIVHLFNTSFHIQKSCHSWELKNCLVFTV